MINLHIFGYCLIKSQKLEVTKDELYIVPIPSQGSLQRDIHVGWNYTHIQTWLTRYANE